MNLGYTGKPYDAATGLYNYGYRDYKPQVARFTTVDPVRDGNNWFAYVNNDPVNWRDLWGLCASDNNFESYMDFGEYPFEITFTVPRPDPIKGENMVNAYTLMAGTEMVGSGLIVSSGGGIAIMSALTGISTYGIFGAISITVGGGALLVGGVIVILIGIDILEGNGTDKTDYFINKLRGKNNE